MQNAGFTKLKVKCLKDTILLTAFKGKLPGRSAVLTGACACTYVNVFACMCLKF